MNFIFIRLLSNICSICVKDVNDVLAAVDHAIDTGLANPSKIAVLGGSHGGFLTTHLIGQVLKLVSLHVYYTPCVRITYSCHEFCRHQINLLQLLLGTLFVILLWWLVHLIYQIGVLRRRLEARAYLSIPKTSHLNISWLFMKNPLYHIFQRYVILLVTLTVCVDYETIYSSSVNTYWVFGVPEV